MGTFPDKPHVQPCDLPFISLLLQKTKIQRDAESFLKLNSETSVNWNSYCCEVWEYWLGEQTDIGDPRRIVEIDESKFGRNKYNRGRDIQGLFLFPRRKETVLLCPDHPAPHSP